MWIMACIRLWGAWNFPAFLLASLSYFSYLKDVYHWVLVDVKSSAELYAFLRDLDHIKREICLPAPIWEVAS